MFFLNELLTKALIKRARTQSVAAAYASAALQYNRSAYIIRVLEASPGIRSEVKDAAVAAVALAPDSSEGQKQLVGILAMFEILSADQKAAFIYAYKATAGLAGHGPVSVVLQNTWQGNHNPPYYEP